MSRDFIIKKNAPLAAMKALPLLKDLGDDYWESNPKQSYPNHRPSLSRSKISFSIGGVVTPKSTKGTNSNTSLKTQEREPSTTGSHKTLQRQLNRSRIFGSDLNIATTPKSSNLPPKLANAPLPKFFPYGLPEDSSPRTGWPKDKTNSISTRQLANIRHRQFSRISSFKLEPLSALDSSPRGLTDSGSNGPQKELTDPGVKEITASDPPKKQNFLVSAFLEGKLLEKNKNKIHTSQRSFRVDKRTDRHAEISLINPKSGNEDILYRSDVGISRHDTVLVEKSQSTSPARHEGKTKARHFGDFESYYETIQGVSSNKEKPNQDYFAERDFTLNVPSALNDGYPVKIRVIADGHGVNGHLVARLVSERLCNFVAQEIKSHYKLGALILDGGELAVDAVRRTLTKAFLETDKQLENSNICLRLSGATLTLALICLGYLFLANVGDSTAVLVSKDTNQNMKVTMETPVHHPDDKDERARIVEHGGLVTSSRSKDGEHEGPLRVWRKDMMGPGLAVTRSFGDRDGRLLGVICNPGSFETYP